MARTKRDLSDTMVRVWRDTRSPSGLQGPRTLRAQVRRRFRDCDTEPRRVLQQADA